MDTDKIAELAADIIELIEKRNVPFAEGALALQLAADWQTSNRGCPTGWEHASKELHSSVGDAASNLLSRKMEARGW